jgi:hypothetical protein
VDLDLALSWDFNPFTQVRYIARKRNTEEGPVTEVLEVRVFEAPSRPARSTAVCTAGAKAFSKAKADYLAQWTAYETSCLDAGWSGDVECVLARRAKKTSARPENLSPPTAPLPQTGASRWRGTCGCA